MAGPRDLRHGGRCHGKTWINVLFGLLQLLLPGLRQGEAQLQALAQMASVVEVWEAEEAELLLPSQGEEDHSTEGLPQEGSSLFDTRESRSSLSFQPSALAYGAQPLGLPRAETVHVHNPSQELPVTVLSVFTPSRHFHTPSFHRRVIPPRGKASFKLIFFPTEEGSVESTLFINTTLHGVLSYQVSGVGVHHGSSNVAQNRDGTLVFPHIQSIKLTQTQGDASNVTILGLLMESTLPKDYVGHPQGSCFQAEQKLVAQISLSERGEKHTDLEKLKPYVIENILVLFVVPSAANSLRVPKINIYMLNSGVKKLFVKEIQLFSKVDSTVEFKQVLLRASSTNFTQVASLVCKGPFPANGKKCLRQISLQLLRNHTVKSHPAFGILSRDLGDGSPVQFHINQTGDDHADVWLTSPLDFSFEVRNVTMTSEMDGLLEVVNFSGPLAVHPGCWRLLSLQLTGRTLPVSVVIAVTLGTSLGVSLELPFHFHSSLTKQGDIVFEASGECGRPCRLRLSESGRGQWQRSFLDSASSWQTDSILASELCARWRSHKKRLTCSWPRLPVETSSHLDFGASPVNESKVKFFTLKNPSSHPVSVELRPLASYSAPLGALDLLTKWFNISPLSVNVTATEFTLLKGSGQEEWQTADGALRLLLQPLESREVGVAFTPTEHKSVTSLILIRNNLTVFDVVMVRGHGARELLRIGGKLPGPGASLRFNVPQSTLMECRDGLRSNKPLFAIRKSFKVENAGELPLTVESMNINGYKCQGFGFEILQCRSFQLDYNSSSEINIVFTPDFTSSWVIRDMTLVTARGSTFPFTLNVTLPHHMLPLCAQVVPGPSWEETFWLVTIIFTCLSLGGVCLMAFHRAQYILTEFSSPGPRSNHHNSVLSRENGVVNAVTPPSANRIKGSCKTFVDSCNTSDKGKGKGSLAVANTPVRSQTSSKKGSGALSQPQRKHKVSLYYSRYKVSSPASAVTALEPSTEQEERSPERGFEQDPESCCSVGNGADEAGAALPPAPEEKPAYLEESRNHGAVKEKEPPPIMFPMETHSGLESVTTPPGPRPGPLACSPAERPPAEGDPTPQRKEPRKRDVVEVEPREESHMHEVPQPEKAELVAVANGSCKGKKNMGKNRRKPSDAMAGIPEPIVVVLSEKSRDLEWRDSRTAARARNHCGNGKLETLKSGPSSESLVKQLQNGARMTRSRRKGPQRRPQWESGSDSASSSGSVRASRGSWGSWSSTSSVEGEKDAVAKHHCNAAAPPTRKRDNVQHMYYPERDCHQALNSGYKTLSTQSLHRRDPCQSPEPAPTPSFSPSFAAVAAAGVERNADPAGPYLRDEKWAAPSVPLTNEFRYNTTESLSVVPQASTSGSYSCFPWGFPDNSCANPYPYCEQNSYMPGNAHLQNSYTCPENKNMAYSDHASWTEDSGQDMPTTWISPTCMGSKPYFSGTRSLSPMSGLFGSIWTPQSEPYQSTFQPERSLPPSPESPFIREPVGSSRPKPFSNFNPFGPHMNLDIWNSSSNRSSNSQLSNDSGYCGDT
ncbi:transmembrane protein 131-like isoform X1 [Brienomyrus brachyistius]|uniref:transmembrane protein 131-like isoform X1 n=2 Tax=Brienomyrus brachyistius TaxID=42636 RepID=UPI0020B312BF|nr:transmembrane protein 131-like isoform X1 [Brienomyrus brachyistius]